jgi:uncharacterized MnhB-related membrane protein
METLTAALQFAAEHYVAIVAILLQIVALVAVTKWGQTHKQALELVTTALERLSRDTAGVSTVTGDDAKRFVESESLGAPKPVLAALDSAVGFAESNVRGKTDKKVETAVRGILRVGIRLLPVVARLLLKPVLAVGFLGLVWGCITTTVTAPDGTVTKTVTVDKEALGIASASLGDILDRIERAEERKAEAEARGDAAEVSRLDRVLDELKAARDKKRAGASTETAPPIE